MWSEKSFSDILSRQATRQKSSAKKWHIGKTQFGMASGLSTLLMMIDHTGRFWLHPPEKTSIWAKLKSGSLRQQQVSFPLCTTPVSVTSIFRLSSVAERFKCCLTKPWTHLLPPVSPLLKDQHFPTTSQTIDRPESGDSRRDFENNPRPLKATPRCAFAWVASLTAKCVILVCYVGAVWAFGLYDSQIATPWTLGFCLLWVAFGSFAGIAGGILLAVAPLLSMFSVLGLVIAAPHYPEAWSVLVTLTCGLVMFSPLVWVPLVIITVATVLIYYLNTGGLGL